MNEGWAPLARRRGLSRSAALAMAFMLMGCGDDDPAPVFPRGAITLVVPYAEGDPADMIAGLIAVPMSAELNVDIVVENVVGAEGPARVAQAEPDGYTLLLHDNGMSTAPAALDERGFDPLQDFETVGLVARVPMTLVGRPDLDARTLQELVNALAIDAASVNLGHAGAGSAAHLCGLLFQHAAQVSLPSTAFEGARPALASLEAGDVDLLCEQTTLTLDPIVRETVRAYAITSAERADVLPLLPTAAEAGLPDLQLDVWHGLYAPAGTPREITRTLGRALQAALNDAKVLDRLARHGAEPASAEQVSPAAHRALLEEEIDTWQAIIE